MTLRQMLNDARRGIQQGRERRREIARNLATVAELEAQAVRITHGPLGRCFEMADGMLFTILNEQPASTDIVHWQYVQPVRRADAEDFYGWTRR